MSEGIALSDDTYGRIERVVRAYESSQGGPRPSLAGQATTHVRCTSSTATDGLYPGIVTSYSVDDELWSDVDGTDVVMLDLNGRALVADTRYECVPVGVTDAGDTVMVTVGAGAPCCDGQPMVYSTCWSRYIPKRIYLTYAGGGSPDAVYALDWDSGFFWNYTGPVGLCSSVTLSVTCTKIGSPLLPIWAFTTSYGGGTGVYIDDLGPDQPFPNEITYDYGDANHYLTNLGLHVSCGDTLAGTWTITDTAPPSVVRVLGGSTGLTFTGTTVVSLGGTLNAASGGTGVNGSSAAVGTLLQGNGTGFSVSNVISGGTW